MLNFAASTVDTVVQLVRIHSLNQKSKCGSELCHAFTGNPVPLSWFVSPLLSITRNDRNKTNLRNASVLKRTVTEHRQLIFDVFSVLYKYFHASVLRI